MKRTTMVVIIAVLAALAASAVAIVPSLKTGPAWNWSDPGSSASGVLTTVQVGVDADILFGKKENIGLRIGMDIIGFPVAQKVGDTEVDISEEDPVFPGAFSLGGAAKLAIDKTQDITLALALSFSSTHEETALATTDTFVFGLLGDIQYSMRFGKSPVGLDAGLKIGGPLGGTVNITMGKTKTTGSVDLKGFSLAPYVGVGFHF